MRGFQLWVNLPADEKMTPASYRDIAASQIPAYAIGKVDVKAIAGRLHVNDQLTEGAVNGLTTEPGYLDLHVHSSERIRIAVPDGNNVLVYVYEGSTTVGDSDYTLAAGKMARLSQEGELLLQAAAGTRVLVISGKPLDEPIVHYGPFVMNTMDEIQQAVNDYSAGQLVKAVS